MALTNTYLIATKNLAPFLEAIRSAKAPEKLTLRFIEDLGFKSTNDRLFIPLLKALKFIDENGAPLKRYFDFLDNSQSSAVLAAGVQDAYEDLFRLNRNAHKLSANDVSGKLKSLTEGKKSEEVINWMTRTFMELCKLADFDALQPEVPTKQEPTPSVEVQQPQEHSPASPQRPTPHRRLIDGVTYRIEIVLPSVRDPAVYDAIFRSLKEHLL